MHNLSTEACPFKPMASVAAPAIVVGKVGSQLSITRVKLDLDQTVSVAFEPEDAWYAVLQLRDAPAHRHWSGGQPRHAPVSPRGCVQIVDLGARASAIVEGPFDSLNIHISRRFLDDLSNDIGAPRIDNMAVQDPWVTADPTFQRLGEVMLTALSDKPEIGPLLLDNLTVTTAVHLAEHYGGLAKPLVRRGTLAAWQERRAKEMIAADLSGTLSLADVAAECRLSLAHFSRAFKVSVGDTPHGWLQARRIDRAKALLGGSQSLSEIAVACGFADQSHFTRMFKRSVGLTPGSWRRAI